MKSALRILPFVALLLIGCASSRSVEAVVPEHRIFLGDNDSLDCKIFRGEILVTNVLTIEGDTLQLNNDAIDRIVSLGTGQDVTDRYINRDVLKVELMKKDAFAKREKLKADVAAGKKKRSELNRIPFAILSASMDETSKTPQVMLTILNLSTKKISLVKTRIYCLSEKGQPVSGSGGKDNVFDASSRIPIGPGEDFTTTLVLRNHPKTKKAKIEIHYLEFSDRTWWKGKVEETAE